MKRAIAMDLSTQGPSRPELWRLGWLALLLGLLLSIAAPPAFAQSLDELRRSGALGERHDGLVEVRDPGNTSAKRVAQEVNAKRQNIYEERAAAQGVSAGEVGKVYASKIMQEAPKGTWFRHADGKWRQK